METDTCRGLELTFKLPPAKFSGLSLKCATVLSPDVFVALDLPVPFLDGEDRHADRNR